MNDITLSAAKWHSLCERMFRSWGAPDDIAARLSDSLVGSDLAGVHSHGLLRIPDYYACVTKGLYDPAGRPTVIQESAVTAVVDGHWGFGQVAMHGGLELGIAKAREQGIAGVGVIHAGHVGRLGEYVEGAAAAGMIALMGTSSGGNVGIVAPYGGRERALSSNPIAAAVPARSHPPFLMDFATTVVAAGKVELAPDQDMPIPEGWAVNAEGRPARTPREVVQGGAMLPFAGHKGYALSLLVELLAGGVTGAGLAGQKEKTRPGSNASFLIVIDTAHFTDADRFSADVDALFDRIKTVKPAVGVKEVMIPGEPEASARVRKAREGITLEGPAWARIAAIASERGVSLDGIHG